MEAQQEQILQEGIRNNKGKKKRSRAWKTFIRLTGPGELVRAECIKCHQVYAADSVKNGTSNLLKHANKCSCLEQDGGTIAPESRSSCSGDGDDDDSSSCDPVLEDLARMIAFHGFDSSILEDNHFKRFVKRINPHFELPSRHGIDELCRRISLEEKMGLSSQLLASSAKFNLAAGTARTVEGTVVYIAYHFVDDEWNLIKIIKDAYMVVPRFLYHGPLLDIMEADIHCDDDHEMIMSSTMEEISSSGISRRLFSMAWGIIDDRRELRMNHLNEIFSGTCAVKRELVYTAYVDNVLHSIAGCLADNLNSSYISSCLFTPVSDLSLNTQEREELLAQLCLQDISTYNERWYSFYCSLEILHNKGRGGCSTRVQDTCILKGEQETESTRLLRNIWGKIYQAIQNISVPNLPTSNLCLRELFLVREALQSELQGACGDKANLYNDNIIFSGGKGVADVLGEAKDRLDMNILDSYLIWSIPLVLDPRYNLRYIESTFPGVYGSEAPKYISGIKSKISQLFTEYRNDAETSSNALDGMDINSNDPHQLRLAWQKYSQYECKSELESYLEDDHFPDLKDSFDILNWWREKSLEYPIVARMAKDALSMPTCCKLSSQQTSQVRSMIRGYSIPMSSIKR